MEFSKKNIKVGLIVLVVLILVSSLTFALVELGSPLTVTQLSSGAKQSVKFYKEAYDINSKDYMDDLPSLSSLHKYNDREADVPVYSHFTPTSSNILVVHDSSAWQDVLKATTLSIWYEDPKTSECLKKDSVYSDLSSVKGLCMAPLLVMHEKDVFSIVSFFEEHKSSGFANNIYFYGKELTSESAKSDGLFINTDYFDNEPHLLNKETYLRSWNDDFFDETKNLIVITENNYETATQAAITASFVNAPLFIVDYDDNDMIRELSKKNNFIFFSNGEETLFIDGKMTKSKFNSVFDSGVSYEDNLLAQIPVGVPGLIEVFHLTLRSEIPTSPDAQESFYLPVQNKLILFNPQDIDSCDSKIYSDYIDFFRLSPDTTVACRDSLLVSYLAVARNEIAKPIENNGRASEPDSMQSALTSDLDSVFLGSYSSNKGNSYFQQTLGTVTDYFNKKVDGALLSHFKDTYITIVGHPKNIPFSRNVDESVPLELYLFGNLAVNVDELLTQPTRSGSIFGVTVSDTSAMVMRSLFFGTGHIWESNVQTYDVGYWSLDSVGPSTNVDLPTLTHDSMDFNNIRAFVADYPKLSYEPPINKTVEEEFDDLNLKIELALSAVLFKTDEDTFQGDPKPFLCDNVSSELRKLPENSVLIEGHTDRAGSDEHNQDLSERRAKRVYDYLVSDPDSEKGGCGLNPNILSGYKGLGESNPLVITSRTIDFCKQSKQFSPDFCSEGLVVGVALDDNYFKSLEEKYGVDSQKYKSFKDDAYRMNRRVEFHVDESKFKDVVESKKRTILDAQVSGRSNGDIIYLTSDRTPYFTYEEVFSYLKPYMNSQVYGENTPFYVMDFPLSLKDIDGSPSFGMQLARVGARGVFGYDGLAPVSGQVEYLPEVLFSQMDKSSRAGDFAYEMNTLFLKNSPSLDKSISCFSNLEGCSVQESFVDKMKTDSVNRLRYYGDPLSSIIISKNKHFEGNENYIDGKTSGDMIPGAYHQILLTFIDDDNIDYLDELDSLVETKSYEQGVYLQHAFDTVNDGSLRALTFPVKNGAREGFSGNKQIKIVSYVASPYPVSGGIAKYDSSDTDFKKHIFYTTYSGFTSMSCNKISDPGNLVAALPLPKKASVYSVNSKRGSNFIAGIEKESEEIFSYDLYRCEGVISVTPSTLSYEKIHPIYIYKSDQHHMVKKDFIRLTSIGDLNDLISYGGLLWNHDAAAGYDQQRSRSRVFKPVGSSFIDDAGFLKFTFNPKDYLKVGLSYPSSSLVPANERGYSTLYLTDIEQVSGVEDYVSLDVSDSVCSRFKEYNFNQIYSSGTISSVNVEVLLESNFLVGGQVNLGKHEASCTGDVCSVSINLRDFVDKDYFVKVNSPDALVQVSGITFYPEITITNLQNSMSFTATDAFLEMNFDSENVGQASSITVAPYCSNEEFLDDNKNYESSFINSGRSLLTKGETYFEFSGSLMAAFPEIVDLYDEKLYVFNE